MRHLLRLAALLVTTGLLFAGNPKLSKDLEKVGKNETVEVIVQFNVSVRATAPLTGLQSVDRLRTAQATGVSSGNLWMLVSARPGRTAAR